MDLSDDSSDLSSLPSSDEETQKAPIKKTLALKKGKLSFTASVKRKATPPSSPEPCREASPPHEYVLADNPDIAVIVMFRSRFSEAFPKHVPSIGPQDIEAGVDGDEPSELVENLLCALIGLVLNRKKYVERGHYGRALEEAVQTQKGQWPVAWAGINPLHGNRTFSTMNATERITLLKTLILWSLSTSELIAGMIKDSFKQTRHDDDVNQPLSVQPWGMDGRKRRYWLVEGQNDTAFRLYRENAPKLPNRTWWSVASTIDELKGVGDDLRSEGSQAGRRLADRIGQAVDRLEITEEKRKRKEYRQARRAAFTKPEPGFSLYEGRTRGKRMKYTFSDGEDSDDTSNRRSARQSNRSTPADLGPTMTSSGRHVRSRFGRSYGDAIADSTAASVTQSELDDSEAPGRPRRSGRARADGHYGRTGRAGRAARNGYNDIDELGDEEDAASSEDRWEGDDDDMEGKLDEEDEDEVMSDNGSDDSLADEEPKSLVVQLKYGRRGSPTARIEHLNQGPGADFDTIDTKTVLDTEPTRQVHPSQPPASPPKPMESATLPSQAAPPAPTPSNDQLPPLQDQHPDLPPPTTLPSLHALAKATQSSLQSTSPAILYPPSIPAQLSPFAAPPFVSSVAQLYPPTHPSQPHDLHAYTATQQAQHPTISHQPHMPCPNGTHPTHPTAPPQSFPAPAPPFTASAESMPTLASSFTAPPQAFIAQPESLTAPPQPLPTAPSTNGSY